MAANDIRPLGGPHGGHARVQHFLLTAGESFREGEPVRLDDAGGLSEATDPAIVEEDILGFAAETGDIAGASGGNLAAITYPTTAADGLPVAGDLTGVYMPDSGQEWITANFATAGDGVPVVPTRANAVAEAAGLIEVGGVWFLDVGTATFICRIMRVLDINKNDIAESGQAGLWVVFTLNLHQGTDTTAPLAV